MVPACLRQNLDMSKSFQSVLFFFLIQINLCAKDNIKVESKTQ